MHGGVFWDIAWWVVVHMAFLRASVVSAAFSARSPWPTSDFGSYKVGELLDEFPGVACARPWEPFLDDLDGFDSQREVGGDSEYSFVGGGAA